MGTCVEADHAREKSKSRFTGIWKHLQFIIYTQCKFFKTSAVVLRLLQLNKNGLLEIMTVIYKCITLWVLSKSFDALTKSLYIPKWFIFSSHMILKLLQWWLLPNQGVQDFISQHKWPFNRDSDWPDRKEDLQPAPWRNACSMVEDAKQVTEISHTCDTDLETGGCVARHANHYKASEAFSFRQKAENVSVNL